MKYKYFILIKTIFFVDLDEKYDGKILNLINKKQLLLTYEL